MTVVQKSVLFSLLFLLCHNPLLPQDTTRFTPKVGYEVMTHGCFKWNIIWSPFSMAFLFGGSNVGKDAFSFCTK